MDLRLERAGDLLSNFLEDDLSGANLGLGKEAHLHLERFRSFLHSHYVGQHCYWPPPSPVEDSISFPQSVYRAMYFEFRNLYSYLVDRSSGISMQDNKPVDGGICVFQNIQAFDKRGKYAALPHPLPLVPKVPSTISSRKGLGRLNIFASKKATFDRRAAASSALALASNATDTEITSCGLVQDYIRFERIWTMKEEEAVSCADARKVRWILVYAILQTLISVTQVPTEVRDTEGVQYPLCCQTAGTPPWTISRPIGTRRAPQDNPQPRPKSLKDQILEMGPDMDIVSAKPSPLALPKKQRSKTPSPPRGRISLPVKLSLRTPKPISTTSFESLSIPPVFEEPTAPSFSASTISLPQTTTPTDILPSFSLPTISPGPMLHTATFTMPIPTHHPRTPEPSTPSTSESGANSAGGWSSHPSSEDDMDHASVGCSSVSDLSDYGGDDESEDNVAKARIGKKKSVRRVRSKVMTKQEAGPEIPARSARRPVSFCGEGVVGMEMESAAAGIFRPERASNPEIDAYLLS